MICSVPGFNTKCTKESLFTPSCKGCSLGREGTYVGVGSSLRDFVRDLPVPADDVSHATQHEKFQKTTSEQTSVGDLHSAIRGDSQTRL